MTENGLVIQTSDSSFLSVVDLDSAMNLLVYSLSPSSKRVYENTFVAWQRFAETQGFPIFAMSPDNLIAFLGSTKLSHKSKQARLSHLRRLLQVLHAAYPHILIIQSMYQQVQLLKVKRGVDDSVANERNKIALARQQVFQAFEVWSQNTKLHYRNSALLAVLFYAGLRRSEAAVLLWDDLNLQEGMVRVRHGKGNKERTIPFLGDGTALRMLSKWKACVDERQFVFCGIRKGDHLDVDKPMTDQAVYNVIKATSAAIDLDFAPHDARRTLLTRGLAAGSSVKDMQFIAGHANPDTTLGYAVIKDAYEVKGRAKLDY